MTFSVRSEQNGLEYSPHTLNTFFIQRKNILSPSFYRMISGIVRFRRDYDKLLGHDTGEGEVGPFLRARGYSQSFLEYFLIPLGSSLWSAAPRDLEHFPLQTFLTFFKNHGFLEMEHPLQWKVIKGGSRNYVEKLTASYASKIRLNAPVRAIIRHPDHVSVVPVNAHAERFDQVVLACHSDQALAIIALGTDGGGVLPEMVEGYSSILDLPKLVIAMSRAGFKRSEIEAYMGGNLLRVIKQCTG